MCNRQAWIIVVTTVTISVLLVTAAILVYHYIIPRQVENIEDLEVFVNEFFNELSLSKGIESNNCRCQHPEVKCGKQIHVPQSLQSQLISFCPDMYIICCDSEDQPKIETGSINASYEKTDTDMNSDKHTLSYQKNNNKLDKNGLKFDNLLNQSLENLTEVKEMNKTIFSNLHSEMHHNLGNINISLEVSTEENLIIENIISKSNSSMHLKGTEDILSDLTKEQNTEKNKEMNKDNTGSTDYKKIQNTKNEYDSRNHDENIKSSIDINLIRKTYNDKMEFKPETLGEILNSDHNEHNTLVANHDKDDSDHCFGNDCIHNEHDENEKLSIPGFDHTDEEYTLFDMMNEMGMFNDTLDEYKEQIKKLSRYEKIENLLLNHIEDDTINPYIDKQDSDICSGDDCIQNDQEENKNSSNAPNLNSMGDETESKTNYSYSEYFDLLYDVEDDIGFLLPLFEQNNDNSTSVTMYTAKSKSIKDHIFYYSYLTAFLYVVGFLADFFIPVFSLAGLAVLQFFIVAFPKIIQSQIFDILSPLLKFLYGVIGLL